jgi:hypothetical protein
MSSVLETLSLKELYTRKKNLIYQLEKVDEEIKQRILENDNSFYMEITPYVNTDLTENSFENTDVIENSNVYENSKKIIIKKIPITRLENNESIQQSPKEDVLENKIIRKIHIKIKK